MGKTFAQLTQSPPNLKREKIEVEEWGDGTFYLLQVSGKQHQEITEKFQALIGEEDPQKASQKNAGRIASILLSHCLVDEEGQRPGEEWLMEQPIQLLNRLSKSAMEINGLSAEIQEKLEKN
jgi:hypothetical protein